MIGNATKKMNLALWEPSRLSSEFSSVTVDLTNVQTGDVLSGNHTLKKFWDGFSNVSKRLRDEDGGNHDMTTRNKSTTVYSVIKEPRMFMRLSIRDSRVEYQA